MSSSITNYPPYHLIPAASNAIALVCDSPHSGTHYPADFGFAIDPKLLRQGEDTDVDALWQGVPAAGGALLAATFARSYIDLNRDADDIDTCMISGHWPYAACPSEKTVQGAGLIWRTAGEKAPIPIYDRLLSVSEVRSRLDNCYLPYCNTLTHLLDDCYRRFGAVWHLNLHSMPAAAATALPGGFDNPDALADVVLGDRDGTTCSAEFTSFVAGKLRDLGYRVAINLPYKGAALIARHGRPAQKRHSLQIELHRGLYMNETTRERHTGFATLQNHLDALLAHIAAYIRTQMR